MPRMQAFGLRQKFRHDLSSHVGQTEVTALKAVSESHVINSEQVEDGRMEIVDVDGIFRQWARTRELPILTVSPKQL